MPILVLAWKSLLNRRGTALLTLLSISPSVALLVGVEPLRTETRASFANTISGTDLIVGARTGPVQRLLYAVFRIGNATKNISWLSCRDIAAHPRVAWSIPIALGDSHRGFPVLETTSACFEHSRSGRGRSLVVAQGRPFDDVFEALIGSEVAERLGYRVGDAMVIAHGTSDVAFARHDAHPFRVSGILAPTGTSVDRTVHVGLNAIVAIHVGRESGAPMPGRTLDAETARAMELTPDGITAALVGLSSRFSTFQVQRFVNDYPEEPLMAILPGVALAELCGLMAVGERALLLVSGFVVVVGLLGLLTALLTSLNERRREMSILRSVGARPVHVFALILGEASVLVLVGILVGMLLLHGALWLAQPIIAAALGIFIAAGVPTAHEILWLALVLGAGILVGLIPGYRAYRLSLADGLSLRL